MTLIFQYEHAGKAAPTQQASSTRLNRRAALLGLAALGFAPQALAAAGTQAVVLPVILAQNAPPGVHPAGYWVSEKLDGVRALWDGKALRFRSGRLIAAPAWFTAQLPATALDGELWAGRGQFDALSGTVRTAVAVDAAWKKVRYEVFELPNAPPSSTFTQRSEALKVLVASVGWAQLRWATQQQLASPAALQARLAEVVAAGGEGLMLHWADAPLVNARSPWLLKLKPLFDAQARVLAHEPGKGKFAGAMGALRVQTEAGVQFKLGTGFSDAQRRAPPALGATVVFSYRDTTPSGKPRFARFVREHQPE